MANVKDVAKYFIHLADETDDGISNLKLQKLIYYAQGFHLALNDGNPLFSEDIEAWAHGPVVPEIYHEYKTYGREAINIVEKGKGDRLTGAEIDHLEEVFEVFGQFSAWKLRNMTHEETPWIENESDASVIPKLELKKYFETRVE